MTQLSESLLYHNKLWTYIYEKYNVESIIKQEELIKNNPSIIDDFEKHEKLMKDITVHPTIKLWN